MLDWFKARLSDVRRLDHHFIIYQWAFIILLPWSSLRYRLVVPAAFGYVVSLVALLHYPISWPSLYHALWFFILEMPQSYNRLPSPCPHPSDSVSSGCPLPCSPLPNNACSSPILSVSQPALSLFPNYRKQPPFLPFPLSCLPFSYSVSSDKDGTGAGT